MMGVAIDRNPDILGGTPVFAGTRVPVRILIEHLESGDRITDFLEDFPTVSHEQVVAVLEQAKTALTEIRPGDHWVISAEGDLQLRDSGGFIRTAQKIK